LFLCVIILSKILLNDYNINKVKFIDYLRNFSDFSEKNLFEYQINLIKIIFNVNTNDLIDRILETQGRIIDFTYNDTPVNNNNNNINRKSIIYKTSKNDTEENVSNDSDSIDDMLEEINFNLKKNLSQSKIKSTNNNDNINSTIVSRKNSIIRLSNNDNANNSIIQKNNDCTKNTSKVKSNTLNYKISNSPYKNINNDNSIARLRKNSLKINKIYKNEFSNNENEEKHKRKLNKNSKNSSNNNINSKENSNSNNSYIHKIFADEKDNELYNRLYLKKNTENFLHENNKKLNIYHKFFVPPSEENSIMRSKIFQNHKSFNFQFLKLHKVPEELDKPKNVATTKIESVSNNAYPYKNPNIKTNEDKDIIIKDSFNNLNKHNSTLYQKSINLNKTTMNDNKFQISPIKSILYDNKEFFENSFINQSQNNEIIEHKDGKTINKALKTGNLSYSDSSKDLQKSETIIIAETFLETPLNRNHYNNSDSLSEGNTNIILQKTNNIITDNTSLLDSKRVNYENTYSNKNTSKISNLHSLKNQKEISNNNKLNKGNKFESSEILPNRINEGNS